MSKDKLSDFFEDFDIRISESEIAFLLKQIDDEIEKDDTKNVDFSGKLLGELSPTYTLNIVKNWLDYYSDEKFFNKYVMFVNTTDCAPVYSNGVNVQYPEVLRDKGKHLFIEYKVDKIIKVCWLRIRRDADEAYPFIYLMSVLGYHLYGKDVDGFFLKKKIFENTLQKMKFLKRLISICYKSFNNLKEQKNKQFKISDVFDYKDSLKKASYFNYKTIAKKYPHVLFAKNEYHQGGEK